MRWNMRWLLAAAVTIAAVKAQPANSFLWGEVVWAVSNSPNFASPAPGDDTLRSSMLYSQMGLRYDIEEPWPAPRRTFALPANNAAAAAQQGWNPGTQRACTLPLAQGQGQLSLSGDWQLVALACYGHDAGTKQSAATVAVVALLRYDGSIDTATAFTVPAGTAVYSAATEDGTGVWLATDNGILYAPAGRGDQAVPVLQGRPITHVSVSVIRTRPWVAASGAVLLASSPDDEAVLALRDTARTPWPCSSDWHLCLPRGAAVSLDETQLWLGSRFIYGHSFVPPGANLFVPAGVGLLFVADINPDTPGSNAAVLEIRFLGANGSDIVATPLRRIIFSSPVDFPYIGTSDLPYDLRVTGGSPAASVVLNYRLLRDEPLLRTPQNPSVFEQSALQYHYTNLFFTPPGAYPWLAYWMHGVAQAPYSWNAASPAPVPSDAPTPSASRSRAPPSASPSASASRSTASSPLPSVSATQTASGTPRPRTTAALTADKPLLLLHRIGERGVGVGTVFAGSESGFGTSSVAGGGSKVAVDLDMARPVFFDALDLSTGQVIKSVPMPTARAVRELVTHFRCTQSLGDMSGPMHADPSAGDRASYILLPCYDASPYSSVLSPRYAPPVRVVPSNPALPPYMAPAPAHRVIARVMADMVPDTRTILNPDLCDVARITSVVTSSGSRFVVATHPLDDVPGPIAGRCGFRLVPFGNTQASDFLINEAFPVATSVELIFGRLLVWDNSPSGSSLAQLLHLPVFVCLHISLVLLLRRDSCRVLSM